MSSALVAAVVVQTTNVLLSPPRRLNKIGKNPNIMAQKDEADGNHDSNTISAVVNALAAEAENHNNR